MKKFFHVAPILMNEGSVILPGNWGRILRLYVPGQGNEVLYRESVIEQIRQEEFPDKPSRFDSIFLLESEYDAINYRNQNNRFGIVYEVIVDTSGKQLHRGSYNFNLPDTVLVNGNQQFTHPSILNIEGLYIGMPKIARSYWSTNPDNNVEIVINAPATVTRIIL